MKAPVTGLALFLVAMFLAVMSMAQPAGCSPATTNGTCATATPLVVGGSCVPGTSCAGGAQAASTCLYSGSQCSWYSFTATSATMFVNIAVTATSGCHISSNVYSATGPCAGLTQVSCLSGAPLDDLHPLTGLTVGGLYYVQICYAPGGPCGNNGSAQFCILAAVPAPPCNTCASPCGTASGFTTSPTVQQVVDNCDTNPFVPALQSGSLNTFCYAFTATNTSVNFNVIITSNCGQTGNVTSFSWQLYNSPACGGTIQSGTLANLTFSGLTIGNNYVFCYTFNVPGTCTHSQHCPYFVGASIPLPVTWLGIDAEPVEGRWVDVSWVTASESNNAYFTVERSLDAIQFETVDHVTGAGESHGPTQYRLRDTNPYPGLSYYRVRQTDHDGTYDHSNTVAVELSSAYDRLTIVPNPSQGDALLDFIARDDGPLLVEVHDAYGRLVMARDVQAHAGPNRILLGTSRLAQGVYVLSLGALNDRRTIRFLRD